MAKREIIWSKRAQINLFKILDFYIERNKSTTFSTKLYKKISKEIALLKKHPNIGIKTDILFISLINIISFKCELQQGKKYSKITESTFRILLIISGIVAIYAFLYDHHGDLIGRKITLLSAVLVLTATAIFLINEIVYIRLKHN
jgi:hypothetical protein